MAHQIPPEPPRRGAVADDDGLRRLHFRLWQILAVTLTVLATVWLATLNHVAAILALVTAKHVLVAILVQGLDLYPTYKGETTPPPAPPP